MQTSLRPHAGAATIPAPADAHPSYRPRYEPPTGRDPGDPGWSQRDRFALSCGHAGRTLSPRPWSAGHGLGPDDRKALRTEGSPAPAHPAHPASGYARGGYVLAEAEGGEPRVVLIAAGGEAHIALDARAILQRDGIPARVVALPCPAWFREQSPEYREQVLPGRIRARVSVAVGSALGGYQLLGDARVPVGIEQFGAGAPGTALHRQHGFTAERVAATARASLARAGQREHA